MIANMHGSSVFVLSLIACPIFAIPADIQSSHHVQRRAIEPHGDLVPSNLFDILPRQQKPLTCNEKCRGKQYWDKPQSKCLDCPPGKVPSSSHKKCKDCPAGQKPNALGDKCEGGNDNKKNKEDRFQEKKKQEVEKYKQTKGEENKKNDDKKKKDMRKNLCLTMFVGAGFLAGSELPTIETMGGFAEAYDWPGDIASTGPDIGESNIELIPVEPAEKRLMRRKGKKGGGSWQSKLWKVVLDKIFPKDNSGKSVSISTSKLNKNVKDDRPPSQKDKDDAKNSPGLQKVSQDKNYGLCLAGAALTFATTYYSVSLTPDAPLGDQKPSPDDVAEQTKVCLWADEDDKSDDNAYCWQTYADGMKRQDRLPYQTCKAAHDDYNTKWDNVDEKDLYADDRATAMEVTGGCCAFYNTDQCGEFLFAATNRQDGELTDGENDSISSFWCTADPNCNGKP